jgi:outer membrane protein assembly factor BamB
MTIRATALIVAAWMASVCYAENWPQWRGPTGTGVSAERDLPIVWREDRGVVWKCSLPEWGTSTPAIWDDAIFLTSHTDDDRLLLLRIAAPTGQIVWTREVGRGTAVREAPKRAQQKFHRLHNLASPSPVTDGEVVVVHFGNGDLATFDFDGKQLWKHNLQEEYGSYTIWWGHANSPVLHDGLVISACMQDSLADLQKKPVESYLVAHDARTGRVRWKQPRMTGAPEEQGDAYTTPLLIQVENEPQLVVMGGNTLDAYRPHDGERLWWLDGLTGGRTVTGPTYAHGMIYTTQGMRGPLVAVQVDDRGELTYRDIAWKYESGTPDTCCPVVWDQWLFTVTDDGIARCFDALTGHLHWKERLPGGYKASPLAADGRIYFLNTEGRCTVLSATSRFDKLAENQLDDETIASPAVSGGRLYLRGRKALYCLAKIAP